MRQWYINSINKYPNVLEVYQAIGHNPEPYKEGRD